MKTITLELTEEEASYLLIEMNILLRSYRQDYNNIRFDNPDMGSAFNKVFKVLSSKGEDHENITKYGLEK